MRAMIDAGEIVIIIGTMIGTIDGRTVGTRAGPVLSLASLPPVSPALLPEVQPINGTESACTRPDTTMIASSRDTMTRCVRVAQRDAQAL